MTIIGSVNPAEKANATTKEQAVKTTVVSKPESTTLSEELSGVTKDKKAETEQALRAQFVKKAASQKSSLGRGIATYLSTAMAIGFGWETGTAVAGALLGGGALVTLLGGVALASLLGFGVWTLVSPSDKYKNTINEENQRRTANMIDEKTQQPKGKGIDKSIVGAVPTFHCNEADPVYKDIAIYNNKNGNPEIVPLNETSKAFNALLEGYSTDEQPDLKADKIQDFAYKAKALFLKSNRSGDEKAEMNAAFDTIIKKFTAENSEGGKDLTKNELVAIRQDLREVFSLN